eukprot:jgi/Botrbrau1/16929/Bobra.0266s0005.1
MKGIFTALMIFVIILPTPPVYEAGPSANNWLNVMDVTDSSVTPDVPEKRKRQRKSPKKANAKQTKFSPTTDFRGVRQRPAGNFSAEIRDSRLEVKNNKIWIGTFEKVEDAAKAYDKKALEINGEHAILNFLPDGTRNPNSKSANRVFGTDSKYYNKANIHVVVGGLRGKW